MNEQFDPRTRARIDALCSYMFALEHGDMRTVANVWREAEQDAILERMLLELHDASLETTQPIYLNDVSPFYTLLHAYPGTQEEAKNVGTNNTSPLKEHSALSLNQERSDAERMEHTMNMNTEYTHFPEQHERPPLRGKHKGYSRLTKIFQTLAAVLVVGALVSSFALLLLHHPGNTGHKQPTSAPQVYKDFYVTFASQDGTVYGLQSRTGKVLWQYAMDQPVNMMIQQGDAVYVSTQGNVHKLKLSDGTLLWQHQFPEFQGSSSILVDGNTLAFSSNQDLSVDVVNTVDGSLLWRYLPNPPPGGWTAPIIAAQNNVLYMWVEAGIGAFQMDSGKLLWTFTAVPEFGGFMLTDKVVYLIGFKLNIVTLLDRENGKKIGSWRYSSDEESIFPNYDGNYDEKVLYVTKGPFPGPNQICALRLTDGAPLWCSQKAPTVPPFLNVQALANDTLYYEPLSDKGFEVVAVPLGTGNGTPRWRWQSSLGRFDAVQNYYSIVSAYGEIFVTDVKGLFALSADDGHVLWYSLAGVTQSTFAIPSVPGLNYQP